MVNILVKDHWKISYHFQLRKFDSSFISRLYSAACQTVHTKIKINILRARFTYKEFRSYKALEN